MRGGACGRTNPWVGTVRPRLCGVTARLAGEDVLCGVGQLAPLLGAAVDVVLVGDFLVGPGLEVDVDRERSRGRVLDATTTAGQDGVPAGSNICTRSSARARRLPKQVIANTPWTASGSAASLARLK